MLGIYPAKSVDRGPEIEAFCECKSPIQGQVFNVVTVSFKIQFALTTQNIVVAFQINRV